MRRAESNDHSCSLKSSKNTTSNNQKSLQILSKSLREATRMQENAPTPPKALTKRILPTGPPVKIAKALPKGSQTPSRTPPADPEPSKASPRRVLEVGNLENLIFKGCTVRNHKFWKCQAAPRRANTNQK